MPKPIPDTEQAASLLTPDGTLKVLLLLCCDNCAADIPDGECLCDRCKQRVANNRSNSEGKGAILSTQLRQTAPQGEKRSQGHDLNEIR